MAASLSLILGHVLGPHLVPALDMFLEGSDSQMDEKRDYCTADDVWKRKPGKTHEPVLL
jgi:hypothetical protein